MAVTVYTSESFKNDKLQSEAVDEGQVGPDEAEPPMDTRSDEVEDDADEFSGNVAGQATNQNQAP